MPSYCCVPLCTSDGRKTKNNESHKNISFHKFPKDEDLKRKWIVAIRRDPGASFNITKFTSVCSKHFSPDNFEFSTEFRMRPRLRKDAVPSIFDWPSEKKAVRRKLIRTPAVPEKRKLLHIPETGGVNNLCDHSYASEPVENMFQDIASVDDNNDDVLNTTGSSEDSLVNIDCANTPDKQSVKKTNLQLFELRNKEKFSILRFCDSDSSIRFYTGFASYAALNAFYNFLLPEAQFLYYVGTENTSQGVPYELLHKRGPSRSLSPMEELFITLVRLRRGFPERHLAELYHLSEGHISKILNTWIIFLADRLSYLPIWPSRQHTNNTMPSFFKDSYPTTRVIVDCTEMFIEHPSAADCQRESFSTYKHHNTAKGLLGIAPSGQITFISPLYAGRCSDKKIMRHCGLLDLLEENDGLMADRGFDLSKDLEDRNAHLIMPDFLQGQDQFTEKQLSSSRNIASIRVHVERAVRKVKEFQIISNTIPITLCPNLDKIWLVCAHLANFTGSGSLFQSM